MWLGRSGALALSERDPSDQADSLCGDRLQYSSPVPEMCFGCGEDNPVGLHIVYVDEPDGSSTSTLSVSSKFSGEPGVVHGGIQATILDEVMGHAARKAIIESAGRRITAVTASFQLRYRAPCPVDEDVHARGSVASLEWPSIHLVGVITGDDGRVLTEATARWRILE